VIRLAPLLLLACASGRDSLPEGAPIPPGHGLVVGRFDFSRINWKPVMGLDGPDGRAYVLAPKAPLFAIPLPPGRYEIGSIHEYRPEGEELFFEVVAGEAVYIGTWVGVLGLDAELRDERGDVAAELARRWGVDALRDGLPGRPRRIRFEVDPLLATGPEWDYMSER